MVAGSAFAINNRVVNGSFEDTNYEAAVPGGYTWEPWDTYEYLTVLPGWELSTGGEWNGGVQLIEEEGDDWSRPSDDLQYIMCRGYNDNGWTDVAVFQVLTGLTPGATYNFQYKVAARFPDASETANSWAPDPSFGFQIAEADVSAEGANIAGREILNVDLAGDENWENGSYDFFETQVYTFAAPADGKAYLKIRMANTYGDKNKKENLWMLVDDVRVWNDDEEDEAGISSIVAGNNAAVEYFNLQGVRVENPENGLYIRRQGNTVTKVVL